MPKPQDKPSPVTLNLDTIERENPIAEFVLVLGGRRYVLIDAQDADYRDLLASQRAAAAGRPEDAIELIVPAADREAFFANRLPNWKLGEMFKAYNQHYGLPTPGEAPASKDS